MKRKLFFASAFFCLMLSFTVIGDDGNTHGNLYCPPETQCTESIDPVTQIITYFWSIVT